MSVKEVTMLQDLEEGKKEENKKMVEHPLNQDLLGCQDLDEKIKTWVKEITQ